MVGGDVNVNVQIVLEVSVTSVISSLLLSLGERNANRGGVTAQQLFPYIDKMTEKNH